MAFVLRLSDEETAALRRQADLEGRSMNEVARLAINERIARLGRFSRDDAKVDRIMARDADLLDRL
jgi:hypothetical protein